MEEDLEVEGEKFTLTIAFAPQPPRNVFPPHTLRTVLTSEANSAQVSNLGHNLGLKEAVNGATF